MTDHHQRRRLAARSERLGSRRAQRGDERLLAGVAAALAQVENLFELIDHESQPPGAAGTGKLAAVTPHADESPAV